MKWTFWRKGRPAETETQAIAPPPGPLCQEVFGHLVDDLELGPDWVRTLFWVSRTTIGRRNVLAFRVFSPSHAAANGIAVDDYATLDAHRQLILFSGTVDMENGAVTLMPEVVRQVA